MKNKEREKEGKRVGVLTLDIKGECAVGVDGDDGRSGKSNLEVRRSCVELLGKVHGLDTLGTESGTYGWLRRSLSCRNQELDERSCCSHSCLTSLFRHDATVSFEPT